MISELLSATVLTSVVIKSFYSLKQNGRFQLVDFVHFVSVFNIFVTSRYLWIWLKKYFQSCQSCLACAAQWHVMCEVWGLWWWPLARMVSVAGDNVPGARRGGGTPVVPTIAQWSLVTTRVVNEPSQYSEKAPNRDFFSLLKVPTSAFTIITIY